MEVLLVVLVVVLLSSPLLLVLSLFMRPHKGSGRRTLMAASLIGVNLLSFLFMFTNLTDMRLLDLQWLLVLGLDFVLLIRFLARRGHPGDAAAARRGPSS